MEQIGIKSNVKAINAIETNALKNTEKKNDIPLFSTIEWTNKNDGNVYVGKRIKLTQQDKEVTGIYVFRKDAEPDENGRIQGEFMSYDTFLEKMADELPTVNSQTAKGYFTNINKVKNDPRIQPRQTLSLDEIINQSVNLPDGSVILKPSVCGVVNKIKVDENGNYTLTTQGVRIGATPTTKEVTPAEIVNNKWLCGGTVKKIGDNQYEVKYFVYGDPKNGVKKVTMTEAECKDFMKSSHLLTYLN